MSPNTSASDKKRGAARRRSAPTWPGRPGSGRAAKRDRPWLLPLVLLFGLGAAILWAALARPAEDPAEARRTRLQTLVEGYLGDQPGVHGVAISDLDGQHPVLVNAQRTFAAGSQFKLLILYRVYQRVAAGQLSLEAPLTIGVEDAVEGEPPAGLAPGQTVSVRQACESLITVSSNAAAYALARTVGGWEQVRSVPGELGLGHTRFDDYWWTTPADLLRFYQLLATGRLVNPSVSQEMYGLLASQTRNDRLPSLLPAGVSVAHKTGEIGDARNDAGVVNGPAARYIIVLMSQDPEPERAIEAQARLSRLVYDFYASPPGSDSP